MCACVHLCVVQLKSAVCHQIFFKEAFFIHPWYIRLILPNQTCGHFAHGNPTKVRYNHVEKGYKAFPFISPFYNSGVF